MIKKKILDASRIRCIDGGFSFIPHRFLTDGFLASLQQPELLLYVFLILAADRYGLSYYSYDRICSLLQLSTEQYITARDGLIKKDLIAFNGTLSRYWNCRKNLYHYQQSATDQRMKTLCPSPNSSNKA